MEYKEWIELSADDMLKVGPAKITEIIKTLPWGTKELDEEKALKLSDIHSLVAVNALVELDSKDCGNFVDLDNLSSQLLSLFPDDSHTQTYALGQKIIMDTLYTFKNKKEENLILVP